MKKPKKSSAGKKPRFGRKALAAGILNYFAEYPFENRNYKQIAHARGAMD